LRPRPALDTSTPIFVLRGSFAEYQHAVLCIARSAGRLGVPVYATAMSAREAATRSRYVRRRIPSLHGASERDRLERLLELNLGQPSPVIVPIDDVSAVFVDDHRSALSERFVMPAAPRGLSRRLASKRQLWELCQQSNVPAPASSFPESEDELPELAYRYGYPVVLKRSDAWLPSFDPSAPSVLIARTAAELLWAYRRMQSPTGPAVIVQEYIPGGSDTIWMFNGYFNRESLCLYGFTGQKVRQRGEGTGPTTLGVCVWNQRVADAASTLMHQLGYHGIVDMGFRYDRRDETYKLLDVNPRLGSTFRLFADVERNDVLRAAYLDLTGQPVPRSHVSDGRRWLVEPYDLAASARLLARGELSPSGWLRSLSGVEELAWWARDDPLPFLAMCASLPVEALRYGARRRRRRVTSESMASAGSRQLRPGVSPTGTDDPHIVERYFDAASEYWRDVYREQGLQGLVYRDRTATALRWIEELGFTEGSTALDVGCGPGLMAAQLASRGIQVTATDSSRAMVGAARRQAERDGFADRVRVQEADAQALPFSSGSFDLVVALGLLPWVADPQRVVTEMARVLRPGGWLIVTADNRRRLNRLVEPRENPLLWPLKLGLRTYRHLGRRAPRGGAPSRLHRPGEVERMLGHAQLTPIRRATVGYGPFTFLGRAVMSEPAGLRLHSALSRLSARRMRGLRRLGWHYITAARKPAE
jgi:D-aspartate ligase